MMTEEAAQAAPVQPELACETKPKTQPEPLAEELERLDIECNCLHTERSRLNKVVRDAKAEGKEMDQLTSSIQILEVGYEAARLSRLEQKGDALAEAKRLEQSTDEQSAVGRLWSDKEKEFLEQKQSAVRKLEQEQGQLNKQTQDAIREQTKDDMKTLLARSKKTCDRVAVLRNQLTPAGQPAISTQIVAGGSTPGDIEKEQKIIARLQVLQRERLPERKLGRIQARRSDVEQRAAALAKTGLFAGTTVVKKTNVKKVAESEQLKAQLQKQLNNERNKLKDMAARHDTELKTLDAEIKARSEQLSIKQRAELKIFDTETKVGYDQLGEDETAIAAFNEKRKAERKPITDRHNRERITELKGLEEGYDKRRRETQEERSAQNAEILRLDRQIAASEAPAAGGGTVGAAAQGRGVGAAFLKGVAGVEGKKEIKEGKRLKISPTLLKFGGGVATTLGPTARGDGQKAKGAAFVAAPSVVSAFAGLGDLDLSIPEPIAEEKKEEEVAPERVEAAALSEEVRQQLQKLREDLDACRSGSPEARAVSKPFSVSDFRTTIHDMNEQAILIRHWTRLYLNLIQYLLHVNEKPEPAFVRDDKLAVDLFNPMVFNVWDS